MGSGSKIKDYKKIIPDAYHGTSAEIAQKIRTEEKFIASRGPDQFLGDGVYFFENSRWHAEDWARRKKFQNYVVFRAIINLGKCLDLVANQDHRQIVKHARKRILELGRSVNDAVVINYLAQNIIDIDSVRACNITKGYGEIFPESRFYDYSQLIICVRNTCNIIEFSVALSGMLEQKH